MGSCKKVANELGISPNTLHGWIYAVRDGSLDIDTGAHAPDNSDRGTQYTSELYRKELNKHKIIQSMNSDGDRRHDNARCESMWARMKSELLYDRYNTEEMSVNEVKVLIWRYFISYWNNRRICSANGGLPLAVKCKQYHDALDEVA